MYHFHMGVLGGFAGVDVFFVISGFLITSIIMAELIKGKFSFAVFFERRVRRLFPGMFNLFLFFFVIGWFYLLREDYIDLAKQIFFVLFYCVNFFFFNQEGGYWAAGSERFPLLHFWSLAIEEQFYFVVPLCLFIIWRLCKVANRRLIWALYFFSAVFVVSLATSIFTSTKHAEFAFYLLPTRSWELGMGSLTAVFVNDTFLQTVIPVWSSTSTNIRSPRSNFILRIVLEVLAWSGIALICVSYAFYEKTMVYPGYLALVPCVGTALFIIANNPRYSNNSRIVLTSGYIFSLSPIVWIGSISYALYLWHWPIWVFTTYSQDTSEVTLYSKLNMVFQTFVAATISTNYLENIFRDKIRIPTRKLWAMFLLAWTFLVTISAVIAYVGIGGITFDVPTVQTQPDDANAATQNFVYEPPAPVAPYDLEEFLSGKNPNLDVDISRLALANVSAPIPSAPNRNSGYYFPQLHPNGKKEVCLAVFGSSHAAMYGDVLTDLAHEYNVSIGFLSKHNDNGRFKDPYDEFDLKKIEQLKEWQPKQIMYTDLFYFWGQGTKGTNQVVRRFLDTVFEHSKPEKLHMFGDVPYLTIGGSGNGALLKAVQIKMSQTKNLNFLSEISPNNFGREERVDKDIAALVEKDYQQKNVTFYPVKQLFMSKTGFVQVTGEEVNGNLLYRDKSHINYYGTLRVKEHFRNIIFKNLKCN
eukprot:Awhi_evm1s13336